MGHFKTIKKTPNIILMMIKRSTIDMALNNTVTTVGGTSRI
jgi:hypothetical protein